MKNMIRKQKQFNEKREDYRWFLDLKSAKKSVETFIEKAQGNLEKAFELILDEVIRLGEKEFFGIYHILGRVDYLKICKELGHDIEKISLDESTIEKRTKKDTVKVKGLGEVAGIKAINLKINDKIIYEKGLYGTVLKTKISETGKTIEVVVDCDINGEKNKTRRFRVGTVVAVKENSYDKNLINKITAKHDGLEFMKNKKRREVWGALEKTTITRAEIKRLQDALVNDQDKFLVECLWNGLYGEKLSEIINLKISDIDFVNKKLINSKKELELTDEFFELAKKAHEQKYYYKQNAEEYSCVDFELIDSDTILKVRPLPANNYGKKVSYDAIRARMTKIARIAKVVLSENKNKFTAKDIYHASIANRLIKIKYNWKIEELEKKLKNEGYNCASFRINKLIKNTINEKSVDSM